jgi:hypothetical protein
VLDLGREVERQRGKLGVHGAHHGQRVSRSVQEIRIAEGDVGRPFARELADVIEDDVGGHHEEAAAIDGRDRTVQAQVQAAAARFHVADQFLPAVLVQMRVLLQSRQAAPPRLGEGQALQTGLAECLRTWTPSRGPERPDFTASTTVTSADSYSPPITESPQCSRR